MEPAPRLLAAIVALSLWALRLARKITMSQSQFALYLAIPLDASAIAGANAFFQGAFLRDASDEYTPLIGPEDEQAPATHRFSGENFSAEELALLRPWVSEGGDGYLLGVRARLSFFEALESTADPPPAGKVHVDILGPGATYPTTQEGWAGVRVSLARFFEEVAASAGSQATYALKPAAI